MSEGLQNCSDWSSRSCALQRHDERWHDCTCWVSNFTEMKQEAKSRSKDFLARELMHDAKLLRRHAAMKDSFKNRLPTRASTECKSHTAHEAGKKTKAHTHSSAARKYLPGTTAIKVRRRNRTSRTPWRSHTSWRRGRSRWVHRSSQRPLVLRREWVSSCVAALSGGTQIKVTRSFRFLRLRDLSELSAEEKKHAARTRCVTRRRDLKAEQNADKKKHFLKNQHNSSVLPLSRSIGDGRAALWSISWHAFGFFFLSFFSSFSCNFDGRFSSYLEKSSSSFLRSATSSMLRLSVPPLFNYALAAVGGGAEWAPNNLSVG